MDKDNYVGILKEKLYELKNMEIMIGSYIFNDP